MGLRRRLKHERQPNTPTGPTPDDSLALIAKLKDLLLGVLGLLYLLGVFHLLDVFVLLGELS